jgi:snRNA-activating protein complex subunit 3
MHDTQLLAITLRLNQPYWVLHAGNCEHTIVIDEIR